MSGIELAGVALGSLSLVIGAVERYRTVLRIISRSKDAYHIRSGILLQRARLETSLQNLSRLQQLPSEVEPILNEMLRGMDKMVDSLIVYARRQEKASVKVFSSLVSLQGDWREIEYHLQLLSKLNNSLETAIALLVSSSLTEGSQKNLEITQNLLEGLETIHGPIEGQKLVKDPLISPPADNDPQSSERGHHPPEKVAQDAGALKKLVKSCSSLLRLRGMEDPEFAELSNRFELWRYGVESERFYEAIKQTAIEPRQGLRHNLTILLYQAILHVGETIAQSWDADEHGPRQRLEVGKALDEFATVSIYVRGMVQDLDLPPPDTDADGPKDDLKAATIQTLELVIGTLRDCLPSIVSFARTCMVLENNIPAAGDVAELLEASVKLIGPGSDALSRVTAVAKSQPDKSRLVDMEGITEEFNRYAACLEKWAEKHRNDIETKLASKNPAKLASVADVVENIAVFLDKLPTAVDNQFGKASTSTKKGPPDIPDQETVESIMEGLETYVQSLIALESQLDSIEPPPPYSKNSRDRVVIDIISGEVVLAS